MLKDHIVGPREIVLSEISRAELLEHSLGTIASLGSVSCSVPFLISALMEKAQIIKVFWATSGLLVPDKILAPQIKYAEAAGNQ